MQIAFAFRENAGSFFAAIAISVDISSSMSFMLGRWFWTVGLGFGSDRQAPARANDRAQTILLPQMGDRDDHLLSEGHPDARGKPPAQKSLCGLLVIHGLAVRSLQHRFILSCSTCHAW